MFRCKLLRIESDLKNPSHLGSRSMEFSMKGYQALFGTTPDERERLCIQDLIRDHGCHPYDLSGEKEVPLAEVNTRIRKGKPPIIYQAMKAVDDLQKKVRGHKIAKIIRHGSGGLYSVELSETLPNRGERVETVPLVRMYEAYIITNSWLDSASS